MEAQEMIIEADKNNDGVISYEEFRSLFEKQYEV